MVEELKLAIKIDDASIEQSLLKQFVNAQKMADKVVLDFKNVNFDDKKIEAKFKEMQKKAGQNPIDLTIGGNTFDMLGQIDKRLTEIFSIGKGKSFIDSSSTVADIGKIENKINELNKRYEEMQKKLSSVGSEGISGKGVNLVDNAEFQKLSQEVQNTKSELSDLKDVISNLTSDNEGLGNFADQLDDRLRGLDNTVLDLTKRLQTLYSVMEQNPETNISSGLKDAFPDSSTDTKPEIQGMDQVEKATEEAVQAKKDFATANEGVQSSINGSENPLKLEAELMEQIAKSAREAADAKKEFVEANKQVKDSADGSNSDLKAKPKKDKYAKRRKISEEDFLNYSPNGVNEKLSNSGYTILGETVNTELVDGLVKVSAKIKDADGAWKSFSAKVDADGNIFEQRFKTVTNGVDKLETALQNFGRETAPALTYQETLDKAQKIKNSLNLGDEYSIKVDNSEFVTITKKLTDVENAGASVTQTFKSAQDAIDNFGKAASNSAEKTSVALKSVKEKATTSSNPNDAQKQQSKTLKEEWTNAIKTVKEYESVVSKLNNLKASDKGLGTKTADIEAQQKKIDDMKSSFESAQATILSFFSSIDKFNSLPVSSIKEVQDAIKLIQTAANGSSESVSRLEDALRNMQETSIDKLENKLSNYQKKTSGYSATINKFGDDGWTSPEYLEKVQKARKALRLYKEAIDELKANPDLINKESLANVEKLGKDFEDVAFDIKNMTAAQKGYTQLGAEKALDKISQMVKENSKMSRQAKADIKAWYDQIASGNPSASLDVILGKVEEIVRKEKEAGRGGKSMWDKIADKVVFGYAAQLASYFLSFSDFIRYGQQGLSVVRELDTALTEMRKVSDESIQTLKDYQKESFNTADAIATTGLQMQNSIADWQRLGYSIKEANELAKNSNIYKNVGDMDISTATEHMVSSVQAWKSEFNDDAVKTSEEVMNRYNKIGNEFAISSADIGEAMETSAAALKAGGNDLNEALGIITAGNIIQQDASTTSSAMKILSLRIRGAKADLESMGESTDDLVESTSKLREEIKGLTGVDIMADENTFKSTAEIIKEIGAVWDQLSDVSQAATLEKLAGKNRASTVAGLIENYETIDKVIEAASNADNSALDENQKIIESIDGQIQQLSNRVQEFWYNLIDDSVVKSAVSAITTIVEGGTKIVDTFGTLPTLLTAIGAALSFKNVGGNKMHFPMNILDGTHNLLWIQRFRMC